MLTVDPSLDRYMALSHVPRHELQLLGVTCLWVSAKYEEVHPPSGANFSAMTQHSCRQVYRASDWVSGSLRLVSGVPAPATQAASDQVQ